MRVTFICRYTRELTGVVRSILMGLYELGCKAQEINVAGRPDLLDNPMGHRGGNGPVAVRLRRIEAELAAFGPDVIIFCAGGLTFCPKDMAQVKARYPVVGITLSDPDVFPTVSRYAGTFTMHTTNSPLALSWYRSEGIHNTVLLPFAVDSRFFVPWPVDARYRADVAVIGHAWPERLPIAERLVEEFTTRLYGNNWPWASSGPVHGDDWFRAAWSARCLVNFPRTRAGHINVKVGLFEATATGRLVCTEFFEEMGLYFAYGHEVVGYSGADDLVAKLRYYLSHPEEAERVARAGQLRCGTDHTWARRLSVLFTRLDGILRNEGSSFPVSQGFPLSRQTRT
ncbi:MAG: glycosyltransferase [Bacillota bacterium]|nr:glycosyltransferase [Bacillota bacterium]